MLWFPDLGQVGLDLAAVHTPLGMPGAALPAAVALAMFANINRSFGTPANSQKGDKCLTRAIRLSSMPLLAMLLASSVALPTSCAVTAVAGYYVLETEHQNGPCQVVLAMLVNT